MPATVGRRVRNSKAVSSKTDSLRSADILIPLPNYCRAGSAFLLPGLVPSPRSHYDRKFPAYGERSALVDPHDHARLMGPTKFGADDVTAANWFDIGSLLGFLPVSKNACRTRDKCPF